MRTFGTSLSVGLGALLLAGNAFAQAQCETSDDCGAGMVCEIVGSSGCAGAPDCAEGADCEPAPACEPMDIMGCVPAPCESDADCGADMVCHTETWESCAGTSSESCDSEGNCEVIDTPADCETGSTSQCIYRWQAGCDVDADCGDGFTCESYEVGCDCAVSGGAEGRPAMPLPAESADGGAADVEQPAEEPAPDVPQCECAEPQKVNYCEPKPVECDTEADCPDGWTCESQGGSTCGGQTDPAVAPPPDGSDGFAPPAEGAASDADAGAAEALPPDEGAETPVEVPCEPVEGPKMCIPPGGGYGSRDDVGTGAPTSTDAPEQDTGGDPTVDVDESGELGGGAAASEDGGAPPKDENVEEPTDEDNTSEAEEAEETEGATGESEDADDESSEDSGGDDGGCSVQAGLARGTSPLWLSALLGLALLRRRKH